MNRFEKIIGHNNIKEHFKSSIKLGKISHAYIINGEQGMGKKLLANTFAKTLQCLEKKDEPCGKCTSCQLFNTSNHPDIKYVESSKVKSIGVDDIRKQLNQDIYIKPYRFSYKIYIIDEAEKLTEQAQNAMLKTIEEPPKYAIIILLTNNSNKLLSTIISRCVILNLKPLAHNLVKEYLLTHMGISKEKVGLYVAFSQGSIGRAINIIESTEFVDMMSTCISLLKEIPSLQDIDLLNRVSQLEVYKDTIQEVLELMVIWYRDMLIVKSTHSDKGIILKNEFDSLLENSHKMSYNKIGKNINYIEKTKQQISYNVNFQLSLETLLLKIKES
ncbi:MAG: DNA polymerase III subunit delta' [Eubacteriales bacterium]